MRTFKSMIIFYTLLSTKIGFGQISVNPNVIGQNAWYINNSGSVNYLDTVWATVGESGVKFIRIGGISANFEALYDFDPGSLNITNADKLIYLIDRIRENGMEPIIQVSMVPANICSMTLFNGFSVDDQAEIAGNLVSYINSYYTTNKIINWSICNEPDLTANNCQGGLGLNQYVSATNNSAIYISHYLKLFSTKMKNSDPYIRIIGPELATFGSDQYYSTNQIMNDLISNPINNTTSVMGTIQNGNGLGKYYIDIISYHYYPSCWSRSQVVANIDSPIDGFKSLLSTQIQYRKGIINMIENNNTGRNISNLKIAITEFNLDQTIDDESFTNYATLIKGFGNCSFLAGQWVIDGLLSALQLNSYNTNSNRYESWLDMANFWSIKEGNGKGYISNSLNHNNRKKPTYHHIKLLNEYLTINTEIYNTTKLSGNDSLKIYVIKNLNYLSVVVINQNRFGNAKTFSINLDGSDNISTSDYSYKVNSGIIGSSFLINDICESESSNIFTYTDNGELIKMCSYSINDAINDFNYNCVNYLSNIELISSSYKIYPTICNDQITLENIEELNIENIEIFNAYGKLVKSISLNNNHSSILINISDLINGIYFVKINDYFHKYKIIKS